MTPAEVREVVADLLDETPTVMPDGRMRGERAWRQAGVHRKGTTTLNDAADDYPILADVHWFETATEWFARSAA